MGERESQNSYYLREAFLEKVTSFERIDPDEARMFVEELTKWRIAVGDGGDLTLWGLIERQISFCIEERHKSGQATNREQFIEYLFQPNPDGTLAANTIMARLRIG